MTQRAPLQQQQAPPAAAGAGEPPALLELDRVGRDYRLPRTRLLAAAPVVHALAGVSLTLRAGRSLGVVGESGSGKSTLARLVMALEAPDAGSVRSHGRDLNALPAAELRRARRDFQMVFQDPYGSLDPRQRVGRNVGEPLALQRGAAAARAEQRGRAPPRRWPRWACAPPTRPSTRTSSRAASASASPSPARWSRGRS